MELSDNENNQEIKSEQEVIDNFLRKRDKKHKHKKDKKNNKRDRDERKVDDECTGLTND